MGLVSGTIYGWLSGWMEPFSSLCREDQRQLGYYDFIEMMSDEGRRYFTESVIRSSEMCART